MSLLIPHLMPHLGAPRAEDKDMLCRLPSSATAAEGGTVGGRAPPYAYGDTARSRTTLALREYTRPLLVWQECKKRKQNYCTLVRTKVETGKKRGTSKS